MRLLNLTVSTMNKIKLMTWSFQTPSKPLNHKKNDHAALVASLIYQKVGMMK